MQELDYQPNRISEDGLRYKSKENSSENGNTFATSKNTMSCLLCGKHTPRPNGTVKKIFGSNNFVCYTCRPSKESFAAKPKNQNPTFNPTNETLLENQFENADYKKRTSPKTSAEM